jgi:hypothetical protein
MSSDPGERFSLRERRAREKARPELNREHRDILVGHPYGDRLKAFLEQRGIRGTAIEESFVAILTVPADANLDQVEHLIDDWMNGADFEVQQ